MRKEILDIINSPEFKQIDAVMLLKNQTIKELIELYELKVAKVENGIIILVDIYDKETIYKLDSDGLINFFLEDYKHKLNALPDVDINIKKTIKILESL
ncbi:hypothetical protein N2W52_002073 [Clostridium perfringens]|nr:hypothetical protein [Clostridium perfringens]MDK0983092.1 hypothetical protein [Clostridium perfringens]